MVFFTWTECKFGNFELIATRQIETSSAKVCVPRWSGSQDDSYEDQDDAEEVPEHKLFLVVRVFQWRNDWTQFVF